MTYQGRSPRSRGRLGTLREENLSDGQIPAFAGETDDSEGESNVPKADPRARGGDLDMKLADPDSNGRSEGHREML